MTHTQIVLFEDSHARGLLFKPLTYTRSFAELLVGCYSGLERIQTFSGPGSEIVLHVRPELTAIVRKRFPEFQTNELAENKRTVFINARLLITEHLFNQFTSATDTLFRWEDQPEEILAFNVANIPKAIADKINSGHPITNDDLKLTEIRLPRAKLFTSLWNMVNSNPVVIQSDIKRIAAAGTRIFQRDLHANPKTDVTNIKNIYAAEGVSFGRRTYLDATEGPILIEGKVVIEPNVTIIGPVVIRSGTLVKAGAKIHPGVTIGPVSKVGGEIENSIIQGYSNKQHDGYLGHSYIGEWCNLGAGTNTSDLKNDYSNVTVSVENTKIETKSLF
ncbi:MAG: putative sugar nucleotidyl transferase, partial [Bacteroidota bacterium]|nr:putative sugar nucleotidyl transferase [Bacteroidota bacterium]